jgi:hypothetical protein
LLNYPAGPSIFSQVYTVPSSLVSSLRNAGITSIAALCLLAAHSAQGQHQLYLNAMQPRAADENAAAVQPEGIRAPALPDPKWSASSDGFVPEFAAVGAQSGKTESHAPARELIIEGLASYGHYKIFASGSDCELYTAGVEYDRHSWGTFLKARVDYVAEFLPVVLLHAPITQDIWGTPTSPIHHVVPGMGISPIGFRMLWRDGKVIKPYLEAKGGMLGFTQKVLSQRATYEDFSLQSAAGLNVNLSDKWGLRLGLFSDFHFSDDFIVPVNPGLDVMNANLGLVYRFRTAKQ